MAPRFELSKVKEDKRISTAYFFLWKIIKLWSGELESWSFRQITSTGHILLKNTQITICGHLITLQTGWEVFDMKINLLWPFIQLRSFWTRSLYFLLFGSDRIYDSRSFLRYKYSNYLLKHGTKNQLYGIFYVLLSSSLKKGIDSSQEYPDHLD